jgi:hypothetical protein
MRVPPALASALIRPRRRAVLDSLGAAAGFFARTVELNADGSPLQARASGDPALVSPASTVDFAACRTGQ